MGPTTSAKVNCRHLSSVKAGRRLGLRAHRILFVNCTLSLVTGRNLGKLKRVLQLTVQAAVNNKKQRLHIRVVVHQAAGYPISIHITKR